ncbi:hypothetical protein CONPUDRAFT_147720 [Coniophora puteana RWD-64-598 SS2]|uniref:DUF6534 domain-containing protein n=1 Tax=Coniophora puteana (strain RWD-64-598) TaxID=741705 RepID=R7SEQ1_CONPW|nr:uncharacterized protein CONPUDRAFT_147720 [Coniophora puteana RWD-64-598 SS2]EIW74345.1 hypothetical protein CONPUDRAFT_147720 [Coniophora puteana RWD-64-598 SS2]
MGQYDTTLGLILLGAVFNSYLYGIECIQIVRYFRAKVYDRRLFKILLASVFLTDTAYTIIAIWGLWVYTITSHDDPDVLQLSVWQLEATSLFSAWPAIVTQMYLIWRTWRLVANKVLVAIASLLSICSLAFGVWAGSHILATRMSIEHNTAAVRAIQLEMTLWLITTFVADAFITITLSAALLRVRTGVRQTDRLIHRLIRGAIQTGVFAGVCVLANLLTFAFYDRANLDVMFSIMTGRVYTLTLLYSLMVRKSSDSSRCARARQSFAASRGVQLTSAISAIELESFDCSAGIIKATSNSNSNSQSSESWAAGSDP